MSETPDWFWSAIDTKTEKHFVEVDECDINYRTWSEPGNPGLLFVHGHSAHSHWWDFIAPSFMNDFHTAAIDLSGMGDSDHRDVYTMDLFAEEILAVADAAGLPPETYLVSHSFGGIMSIQAAARKLDRFSGLCLIDSGLKDPGDEKPPEVERWAKPKVYPGFDAAKSRFRLRPAQTCENGYLVEYIARNSVEHIDEGWVWKFDEELDSRMEGRGDLTEAFKSLTCKLALIYGADSESFTGKSAQYMQSLAPQMQVVELAAAQHHLFLDQPLAFIETLSGILAGWRC
jgi:pimeloyl-ACP methyl ester carboxylesterase